MNYAEKTALVREVAKRLDRRGCDLAKEVELLRSAGFVPNAYVGADPASMTAETTLDWYAGQLISIYEKGGLFAVNSWIHCMDKFAPEVLV